MILILIGVLAGLLVASLITNIVQARHSRRSVSAALQHEERLLDRARAAELRAAQQIDAMLDRISTSPRLEVREGHGAVAPSEAPKYISDEPYMDEAWNDYRGVAEDEE